MEFSKTNIIKASFVIGQSISIGFTFSGSTFSIFDYLHPGHLAPTLISDYVWIFGFAAFAAGLGGIAAYKFQGIKIGDKKKRPKKRHKLYADDLAPRNWKSNLAEWAYLMFTCSRTLVYNYFLITAIQATIDSIQDPANSYPMAPLNKWTGAILLIKTILIDWTFKMTNADYNACENIKEEVTDSKAVPLISLFIKPFSKKTFYKPTMAYLRTVGVLSHIITDYTGMLLSIPVSIALALFRNSPRLFWTITGIALLISTPILFVNYMKALYFEAKQSEKNIKRLNPSLPRNMHTTNFLRKLLEWQPKLKKPIHSIFYCQGPIQGGSDIMPVILFMRDFFHRHHWSSTSEAAITVPLALFVFMSSAIGILYSDIDTAIVNYRTDFADIPNTPLCGSSY